MATRSFSCSLSLPSPRYLMDESNVSKLIHQCKASGMSQRRFDIPSTPLIFFSIDVDVKIDSMVRLQAEFENGATVRLSAKVLEISSSHHLPLNDRFPTPMLLSKPSRHASEFHTNIYKQQLFLRFRLSFRSFSLTFIPIPLPHLPRPPLLLPVLPLSMHTLFDKL